MLTIEEKILPLPDEQIRRLKETPQNARYHAEGNVYNHILMVMEQFRNGIDQFDLSDEDKEVLYWAVLLHDIGKPIVTRWVNDRWSSRGHEMAGVPIARDILLQQEGITQLQRKKILDLVKWHHVPLRWGLASLDLSHFMRLSTQTDLKLLGIFSIFDMNGRICENQESVLELIRVFNKEVCPRVEKDLGTFEQNLKRYTRADIHKKNALWNALHADNPHLLQSLIRLENYAGSDQKPERTCYLTIGPPKSGKTQYLKEQFPDHLYINLDDLRLSQVWGDDDDSIADNLERFRLSLSARFQESDRIVLDGTSLLPQLRQRIAAIIKEQDAELHYLFFEPTLDSILSRNTSSESPLEEVTIQLSYKQLDYPHPWEAHYLHLVDSLKSN